MVINSVTPTGLWGSRVKQVISGKQRYLKGLGPYTSGQALVFGKGQPVTIKANDAHIPFAVRFALFERGVETLNISWEKDEQSKFSALQNTLKSTIRAVASDASSESLVIDESNNLAVKVTPSETPRVVNATVISLDEMRMRQAGKSTKMITIDRILNRLPLKNYFSANFWRAKLADIVISNEKLIDRFSHLTNLMLALESTDDSLGCSKHQVFSVALHRFFPRSEQASLPWLLKIGLKVSNFSSFIFYFTFKLLVKQAAKLFIGGEDLESSLKEIDQLYDKGIESIIDFVDEEVTTAQEADNNIDKYIGAFKRLPEGRENVVSIKLTGLVENFNKNIANPNTRQETIEKAISTLTRLAAQAKVRGIKIIIDMERYVVANATLEIFEQAIKRSNYEYAGTIGIVNQTYLKRAKEITARLAAFAKECKENSGFDLFIRFVKGAYQIQDKEFVVDSHYEANFKFIQCLEIAYEQYGSIRFAIASHNIDTMSDAIELAISKGLDPSKLRFEMLKGMPTNPILIAMVKLCWEVALYFAIGTSFKAMGYFLRRMRENAASSSCQKQFRDFYTGKLARQEYLSLALAPASDNATLAPTEKVILQTLVNDFQRLHATKIHCLELDQAAGYHSSRKLNQEIAAVKEAIKIFEQMLKAAG